MDFSLLNFQELVESSFVPVVLIQTDDQTQKGYEKNLGFKITDFMRCSEKRLKTKDFWVSIKEDKTAKTKLTNFSFRVKALEDFVVPESKDFDIENTKYWKTLIQEGYKKIDPSFFWNLIPQEPSVFSKAPTVSPTKEITPWFRYFMEDLFYNPPMTKFESFQHPVAIINLVSSDNPIAISTLEEMCFKWKKTKTLEIFESNDVDMSEIPEFYILVHDQSSTSVSFANAQQKFLKIKEQFGEQRTRFFTINSAGEIPGDKKQAPLEPFSESELRSTLLRKDAYVYAKGKQNSVFKSMLMAKDDVNQVDKFYEELFVEFVIPMFQEKIKQGQATALSKQKLMKSFISKFYQKKVEKPEKIDVQMRKVADYAFFLHDYETALSSYRQLLSDYKAAKDAGYSAAVNEMIGLCYILSNKHKDKDTEGFLDAALLTYSKMPEMNSLVMRSGITQGLLFQYMRADYFKAAALFHRLGTTIDTTAFLPIALLYEQGGFCYYFLKRFRKFAFFMILSGYRYGHIQMLEHSYRCYKISLPLYYDTRWGQIFDHLSVTMARLSSFMSEPKQALEYMHDFLTKLNLINPPKISLGEKVVDGYLNEFQGFAKKTLKNMKKEDTKNSPLFDEDFNIKLLDIPFFNPDYVRCLKLLHGTFRYMEYEHSETLATLQTKLVDTVLHRFQEKEEKEKIRFIVERGLNNSGKVPKTQKPFVCQNEPFFIELEVQNPIDLDISVRDVKLLLTFVPGAKKRNSSSILSLENQPSGESPTKQQVPVSATGENVYFTCETQKIELKPLETQKIRLKVVVHDCDGHLQVLGVEWKLNIKGMIGGKSIFSEKGKPVFELTVIEEQPFMAVELLEDLNTSILLSDKKAEDLADCTEKLETITKKNQAPMPIYSTEIKQNYFVLKNKGRVGLKRIFFAVSDPECITIGTPRLPAYFLDNNSLKKDSFPNEFLTEKIQKEEISENPYMDHISNDLSIFKIDLSRIQEYSQIRDQVNQNAQTSADQISGVDSSVPLPPPPPPQIVQALEPEDTIVLPIFFRGFGKGTKNISFLFFYEKSSSSQHVKLTDSLSQHSHSNSVHHFTAKQTFLSHHLLPSRFYAIKKPLEISPTVSLTLKFIQSFKKIDSYLANLVVKNISPEKVVFHVNQITAISTKWKFVPLNFTSGLNDATNPEENETTKSQSTEEESGMNKTQFQIHPNEMLSLFMRICRSEEPKEPKEEVVVAPVASQKAILRISNALLKKRKAMKGYRVSQMENDEHFTQPFLEFLFREAAMSELSKKKFNYLAKQKLASLMTKENLKNFNFNYAFFQDIQNIEKLLPPFLGYHIPFCDSGDLSFVIFWRAMNSKMEQKFGQFNIVSAEFLPQSINGLPFLRALDNKLPPNSIIGIDSSQTRSECPLNIHLKKEDNIFFDFTKPGFCQIPVTFQICNNGTHDSVAFSVELLSPSLFAAQPDTTTTTTAAAGDKLQKNFLPFVWNGTTKLKIPELKPREEKNILVSVSFFSPGVYNLNMFRLKYRILPQQTTTTTTSTSFDENDGLWVEENYRNFENLVVVNSAEKI